MSKHGSRISILGDGQSFAHRPKKTRNVHGSHTQWPWPLALSTAVKVPYGKILRDRLLGSTIPCHA